MNYPMIDYFLYIVENALSHLNKLKYSFVCVLYEFYEKSAIIELIAAVITIFGLYLAM